MMDGAPDQLRSLGLTRIPSPLHSTRFHSGSSSEDELSKIRGPAVSSHPHIASRKARPPQHSKGTRSNSPSFIPAPVSPRRTSTPPLHHSHVDSRESSSTRRSRIPTFSPKSSPLHSTIQLPDIGQKRSTSQVRSKDTANYSSVTAASHIPISAKHSGINVETMLEHRVINTKTPPLSSTKTPPPSSTKTPPPSNTKTPPPSSTKTPPPSTTKTPPPSSTKTPPPSSTKTPPPSSTKTPPPSTTKTPPPSTTKTLPPSSTKTPPPSTTSSSDITRVLTSSGPLASETSPSHMGGTGESRYPVQQEGSGTQEVTPSTVNGVAPSRSVKFLSPVHQVVTKPPSSLLQGDHQSGHHGGSPIGSEYEPAQPTKARTPSPSLSRQIPGHSDSGHINISEEPLDLLVPIPSSESLTTGSEQQSMSSISLVSQRSLPVTLGARRAFSPPRAGRLEQQLVLSSSSLPQLDDKTQTSTSKPSPSSHHLHRPLSMPHLSSTSPHVLTSQLNLLQLEKDSVDSQLRQSQATVTSLQAQNSNLRNKVSQSKAMVSSLEQTVAEQRESELTLRETHSRQLAEVRRQARQELEGERERLLNQIRELTKLKEEANARVNDLEDSLSEAEEPVRATPTPITNETAYQREIKALKSELSALQELYHESEEAHKALVRTTSDLEGQVRHLMGEKRDSGQLDTTEVSLLEYRLQSSESRVKQLEQEKSSAVVETEQRMMAESIKEEVKHKEIVRQLKQQLDDSLATIDAQEQRIQMLQDDSWRKASWGQPVTPTKKSSSLKSPRERKVKSPIREGSGRGRSLARSDDFSTSRSPSPPSLGSGKAPPGGRWTAHRADIRKHAEEMLAISEALEQDGYSPSESTAEEVIRHLWWKKEHVRGELQNTRQTLKKIMGGEQHKALEDWQEVKAALEGQLKEADSRQKEALDLQSALQKKLEDVLGVRHLESERCTSLQQREEVVSRENERLRERAKEIRMQLTNKTTELAKMEADLKSSQREHSTIKNNLSLSRHQSNLLQAQVDSLKVQLSTQQQEMASVLESRENTEEKLGSAGKHMEQTRRETLALKAKMGELEGEVSIQQQQLTHVTSQRDSLLEQLDSANMQLTTLESQLSREKANCAKLQSHVECLLEESREKDGDLERVVSRRDDLEVEVASLRKDLQTAQQNITTLETELLALQDDCESCQTALSEAYRSSAELERKLMSSTAESSHSQGVIKKLRASLTATQHELETTSKNYELKKQSSHQLRSALDSMSSNRQKKVQSLGSDSVQHQREISQKNQAVQDLQKEVQTLRSELKEAQKRATSLQGGLSSTQKELRAKSVELSQAQESSLSLQQRVSRTSKELTSCRQELKEVRANLMARDAENTTLVKERNELGAQLRDLKRRHSATARELTEKKGDLQEREDEVQSLKQEKLSLTAELSEKKRDLQHMVQAHQELQSKDQEVQQVQLQVEKLQCSVESERERYSTVELELTTTHMELQQAREQCDKLTSQMELARQSHQQEVQSKQLQIESLTADLSFNKTELKHIKEESELFLSQLEEERARTIKVQGELDVAMETVTALRVQLHELEGDMRSVRGRMEVVEGELRETTAQNSHLTRCLTECQQQLQSQCESTEEARSSQQRTLSSLNHSRDRVTALESQLHQCEGELTSCSAKLTEMEQKSAKLESALQAETSVRTTLESQYSELESSHNEARLQVQELSNRLASESTTTEHLRLELECCQQECVSVQEQLQLQRETAASSLNRIQSHGQEKISELQTKIMELSEELREAHSSVQSQQHDVITVKAGSAELENQVADLTQSNSSLRSKLNHETIALRLSEQKAEQLQLAVEIEKKAKSQFQTSFSEESGIRSEAESTLLKQKKELSALSRQVTQLDASLTKQRTLGEHFKRNIALLESELSSTKQQLDAARDSHRATLKQREKETTALRQKHHDERKSLKDKVKAVEQSIQTLWAQYEGRGEEVVRLDAANKRLTEEQIDLTRRLSETEHSLQTKREECKTLVVRAASLEMHVGKLQKEMSTLGQAQLEFQKYKRKVDENSRASMQRMLAEVTGHMEQQHSAHKYLEKLRAENETIALTEKDRKIEYLKNELKQKKHEEKRYRPQIESLELQAKYLHAHQKEQERSRCRLESRLERVNETLSHSLPLRTPSFRSHSTPRTRLITSET